MVNNRLVPFFVLLTILGGFVFTTDTIQAVTLTPVRIELAGDPGQTIRGEVEVYNEQNEIKTFFVSYENFEPSGEDGSPKFVGAKGGLATWIESDKSITLVQNARQVVPFSIVIPENAEPGGYFGAVFFGGQNPETTGNGEVSVGGKLGTLILLSVHGNITESAGLNDFSILNGRVQGNLPVTFTYRIANEGGDRIVPTGDITVTNSFGMKSAVLPINEYAGSVLPGSARRFQNIWGATHESSGFFDTVRNQWNDLHIGWYTAHARVVWGDAEAQGTARYDFFMLPWQLLLVLALCIGVLKYLLKRYNLWVIARSRKSSGS